MTQQFLLPFDDDEDVVPQATGPATTDTNHFPGLPISVSAHDADGPVQRDTFALALLTLGRIPGVGVKTVHRLTHASVNIARLGALPVHELTATLEYAKIKDSRGLATTIIQHYDAAHEHAEKEWNHFRDVDIQILSVADARFPARLRDQDDGPAWLFIEGNIAALQHPLLGIVGTRKPSPAGIKATERLTAMVCREGFGVVSGLAEGIDATAHRVALYYGVPQVAVLGTGIDVVFPASTATTRRRILETGGAIISEYLPGDSYSRANFVQRNRIQATLAQALCPVESQAQSGTAHTLRFAEAYQRPIFGVHRGTIAPKNEMLGLLQAHHHPIFNLAHRAGGAQLIAWLQQVVPEPLWPTAHTTVALNEFRASYRAMQQEVIP